MAQAEAPTQRALLLKYAEGFGLPSVSPACLQVEAYLRLADISFATMVMKTAGASPTACLPAIEMKHGLGGQVRRNSRDDFTAARSAIAFLQQDTDLDKRLPGAASAECAAFCCLLDTYLTEALRYSMWCEWASLSQLAALYGDTLPWPLNYFIPYGQAVAARRHFKNSDPTKLYDGARTAIEALERRCASSEGPYLLGKRPCSLDAKAYGVLAYIVAAQNVAPALKDALQHATALQRYVTRIAEKQFEAAAPVWSEVSDTAGWSAAATGGEQGTAHVETAEEKKQRRRSWWWLAGAGVAMLAYAVFSGEYIQLQMVEVAEEEEGEGGGGNSTQ